MHLFSARPTMDVVRDLFDVIIVAYIVYRALLVLRGTRAMQMGIGLIIVALVYAAARYLKLVTLVNLLSWLLSSIVLIVVVIFQNDIRRALIRMGSKTWFQVGREQQSRVIDEVVAAATELARHRMGAIIAFEQDANVLEFAKSEGFALDSVVTRELLVALFIPETENKLHDGAVLIRDLKIARAGVFFPMPETKMPDTSFGSRHRAALGITEETDAVVVVVSEERGTISFCFSGNIVQNLDGPSLRNTLLGLFGGQARKKRAAKKPPAARPAIASGVAPRPQSTLPPSTLSPTAAAVSTKAPSAGKAVTLTSTRMKPAEPGARTSNTEPPSSSTPSPPSTSAPRTTFVPSATTTPVSGASPPEPVEPAGGEDR
jgi:uncharacterized protein (TIGR00159 family)